ncbi:sperm-associated antigen 4 protein-like [Grus americana]|uniref:sperm-associated antigen 4 protein-like n=1 Tax=Grus americana TaxID=9117 RepID=UPI0024079134|nr:sperm-associated antigen 4 protein-like [Grus americana]
MRPGGCPQEGSSGFSPVSLPDLVLIVSGSLALALVSLQGYLSTCICTVKEITQKRSGLSVILSLIFIAAFAGAYYGTSLPMWMLWAKEVPQVLQEQPAGELKSVRNSLALLEERVQELQQLRKDVACTAEEMSRLKEELQDMRMAMAAMPLEENIQMSAWTLKSAGVTIDLQRSPRNYVWPCSIFRFLCDLNPLETFVQLDISPGYCWPFQGSWSQVVIRLPAQVRPTAITLQHPLKKSSALGDISSAPRDFTVLGVDEGGEEETLLGTFSYDTEKEATQTFPLQKQLPRAFQLIRLVIQSNWGKSGYTCIYRVQVHGKITGRNAISQA